MNFLLAEIMCEGKIPCLTCVSMETSLKSHMKLVVVTRIICYEVRSSFLTIAVVIVEDNWVYL